MKKYSIASCFLFLYIILFIQTILLAQDNKPFIIYKNISTEHFNPLLISNPFSEEVEILLFSTLLKYDFKTKTSYPYLVKNLPIITPFIDKKNNTNYRYEFELRSEAKWDNGSDITANDVLFTLKICKLNNLDLNAFENFIDNVIGFEIDSKTNKKFSIIFDNPGLKNDNFLFDLAILPAYAYDKNNAFENYTFEKLQKMKYATIEDPALVKLVNDFSEYENMIVASYYQGSGPYQLTEWKFGEQVLLTKKEHWWGTQAGLNNMLVPNLKSIKYVTKLIEDDTEALLKNHQIDFVSDLSIADFEKYKNNKSVFKDYTFSTTNKLAYSYIAFNMKSPILEDRFVRKALSFIIDYESISKEVYQNDLERAYSFIINNDEMNHSKLPINEYHLDSAKYYLELAGYNYFNSDGIRYKQTINNKSLLELNFITVPANIKQQEIVEHIVAVAKHIGIQINLIPCEWTKFIEKCKNHEFDIMSGSWISSEAYNSPSWIWHTASSDGGNNFTYFGNSKTDELIEKIESTLNEKERESLYLELQKAIADEIPYILLFKAKARMIISKKYGNIEYIPNNPNIRIESLIKVTH